MEKVCRLSVFLVILFMIFYSVPVNANPDVNRAPIPTEFVVYPDMLNVNLASGDPSVSIPLLTVPGRGGLDYPLVLKYSSGIKLEQSASWVGLGWMLDIPKVTRSVQGVPDDHSCYNVIFEYETGLDQSWWSEFIHLFADAFDFEFDFIESVVNVDLDRYSFDSGYFPTYTKDLGGLDLEYGEENVRSVNGKFNFGTDCGSYEEDFYDYNSTDLYFYNGAKMFGDYDGFKFLRSGNFKVEDIDPITLGNEIIGFEYPTPGGTKIVMDETIRKDNYRSRTGSPDEDGNYRSCLDNEYYFRTEKGGSYISSWKASEILSHDYVDLGEDGPDDSDLGNWVSFNYNEVYSGGNLYNIESPHSDSGRNCFVTGTGIRSKVGYDSEISVLGSIETPTHIAYFYTDTERADTRDSNGDKLPKLNSIEVRSKLDNGVVSRVEFVYDHSLAQDTPDSSSGRLTLREVITYGSDGTALAPYEFEYAEENLDYDINNFDRWGNYYSDGDILEHNKDGWLDGLIPEAWSLSDIDWPSGGSSHIGYESDRYDKINHWDVSTNYGGGVRAKWIQHCDGYGECYSVRYLYSENPTLILSNAESTGYFYEDPIYAGSSGSISYDMPYYSEDSPNFFVFGNPYMSNNVFYEKVAVVQGYDPDDETSFRNRGFSVSEFHSPSINPEEGTDFSVDIFGDLWDDWQESCQYHYLDQNILFGFCGARGNPVFPREGLNIFVGRPHYTYSLYSLEYPEEPIETFYVGDRGAVEVVDICPNDCSDSLSYVILEENEEEGYETFASYVNPVDELPSCIGKENLYEGDADNNNQCDVLETSKWYAGVLHHGDILVNEGAYGMLKGFKNYDNNFEVVSEVENTYQFVGNQGWIYYSGENPNSQVRFNNFILTSTLEVLEGGTTLTTDYATRNFGTTNPDRTWNGQPRYVVSYGNDLKERRIETYYAYEVYQGIDNLLAPYLVIVGDESTVFDSDLNEVSNAESITRTSYSNNFGNGAWYPSEVENWEDIDSNGIVSEAEMKKVTEFLSYDNYGNLLRSMDAEGIYSEFKYGGSGECNSGNSLYSSVLTCTIDGAGRESKIYYDSDYLVTSIEDLNEVSTDYTFDEFNRLSTISTPGINVVDRIPLVFYDYNYGINEGCNNLDDENEVCMNWVQTQSLISGDMFSRSRSYVDGLGRHIQSSSQKDENTAIVTRTSYNEFGLVNMKFEPEEIGISWFYTVLGGGAVKDWFGHWGGLTENTADEILRYKGGFVK
jgi:hypothetical protein